MQHVLILGASGRFGRNAAHAFEAAGWQVHAYDRKSDDMSKAAMGMDVIVNAMNPSYEKWQAQVPRLTAQVIKAARASGATIILPGNVYNFGVNAPKTLNAKTPHAAQNPLGRVRVEIEQTYRASGVQVIILRAGDFIDTKPSGIWFDRTIIAKIDKGIFTYLGRMDAAHSWAYLPDLTRAAVALAEKRADLDTFEDIPFAGYTLTGEALAQALDVVTGRSLVRKRMSYFPMKTLSPFSKLMRHLVEMSYLWDMPHSLDNSRLDTLLPEFKGTPLHDALRSVL